MIFAHTFKEPGMWRGWFKNGQSVEVSWDKRGWEFGAGIHIHSNDDDMGEKLLFLRFWRLTVVLPFGIVPYPWATMDGPQWSAYASQEFGLTFRWGQRYKSFSWPWHLHTLAYEYLGDDGQWHDVMAKFGGQDFDAAQPAIQMHPYTYVLRSGTVQERKATVSKRRHVLTWNAFKHFGWPKWTRESIDVEFDGEVGERTGSWKGGCIGCGYDIKPGETMLETLRRMEAERKFT